MASPDFPGSYCLSTTKFTPAPSKVERKGTKESTKKRIPFFTTEDAEVRGGKEPAAGPDSVIPAQDCHPREVLAWP
jgi:hypothetical protein